MNNLHPQSTHIPGLMHISVPGGLISFTLNNALDHVELTVIEGRSYEPIPVRCMCSNQSRQTSSLEVACESCAGESLNCTVENPNRVQQCQPVLEHTTSTHAHGDLESLSLQPGFWRSSPTSKDVRECYEPSACAGGAEKYCRKAYQGPREYQVFDRS